MNRYRLPLLTALVGLAAAANPSTIACPDASGTEINHPSGKTFVMECNIFHHGGKITNVEGGTSQGDFASCVNACAKNDACILLQWDSGSQDCQLKAAYGMPSQSGALVAARLQPKAETPISVGSLGDVGAVPTAMNGTFGAAAAVSSNSSNSVSSALTSSVSSVFWVTSTVISMVTQTRTYTASQSTLGNSSLGASPTQNAAEQSSETGPASSISYQAAVIESQTSSMPVMGGWTIPIGHASGSSAPSSSIATSLLPTSASTSSIPALSSSAILSRSVSSTPSFSTPTSYSPAPAPGNAKGKRGVLYTDAKFTKSFGGEGSKVTWASNWNSDMYLNGEMGVMLSEGQFNTALEFVPQLWNASSTHEGQWTEKIAKSYAKRDVSAASNLLSFNEPNECGAGGTCMKDKIPELVESYKKYMQPLATSHRLGSPSVTNGQDGIPWLKDFIAQCDGCQIDYVQAHWYGGGMVDFKEYIEKFYDAFKKPIWITEFAPDPPQSEAEQIEFLKQAIEFLDQAEYVERYAWFMASPMENSKALVKSDGSLTELGKLYNTH